MMAAFEEQVVPFLTKMKFCDRQQVKKFLKFRSYPSPDLMTLDVDDTSSSSDCEEQDLPVAFKRKLNSVTRAAPASKKIKRIDPILVSPESSSSNDSIPKRGSKDDSIGNGLLKDLDRISKEKVRTNNVVDLIVVDSEVHNPDTAESVFSLTEVLAGAGVSKDPDDSGSDTAMEDLPPIPRSKEKASPGVKKLDTGKKIPSVNENAKGRNNLKKIGEVLNEMFPTTQHDEIVIESVEEGLGASDQLAVPTGNVILRNPMIAVGEDVRGKKCFFKLVPITEEEVKAMGTCVPYKLN